MQAYDWYSQLIKPSWSPPSWLFGPVWSVLYVLIAISFEKVKPPLEWFRTSGQSKMDSESSSE